MPTNERLLAVYDPELTEEEMVEMLVQLGAATVPEITGASPDTQSHSFDLEDLSLRLTMAMVPSDSYFASRVSNVPYAILGISIGMVLFAQAERWVGHPSVVSQSGLIRDSIEAAHTPPPRTPHVCIAALSFELPLFQSSGEPRASARGPG